MSNVAKAKPSSLPPDTVVGGYRVVRKISAGGFGLVYLLIGLNVASLIMTKTHQTLYDFLAKTFVTTQGSGGCPM